MNMEKNIITYESCKNVIRKELQADIRTLGLLLPVILIIFVPFTCGFISLAFEEGTLIVARLFWGIIVAPIFAALPVYFIYQLINALFQLNMVNQYKFSIEKDTVTKLERVYRHRREQEVAHFKNYGKFVISSTQYSLTSVNDEYYLVILNANKTVLNAYHAARNEFKEV